MYLRVIYIGSQVDEYPRRSHSRTFEFELNANPFLHQFVRFDSLSRIDLFRSTLSSLERGRERSSRSEYNYPRGGRKIISACPTAMHHPREPIERASLTTVCPSRARVRPDPRFPDFLVNLARVPFPTRSFRPAIDLLSRALDVSTSRSNFVETRLISCPSSSFFNASSAPTFPDKKKKETTSFPYFVHVSPTFES